MLRLCGLLFAMSLALFAGACSDSNPSAPVATDPHPDGWVLAHGPEALKDPTGCTLCHGLDLTGSGAAVSCFTCHIDGPPFQIHPSFWQGDAFGKHQHFANTGDPAERLSWTTCAVSACHGTDLKGGYGSGPTGPTCFSATFTNEGGQTRACHPSGPPASHALPYTAPSNHGLAAKDASNINENMGNYCIHCHGRPNNIFDGGFIAAPAILGNPSGDCSSCHPAAEAHPTNWQGNNDDTSTNGYYSSHRSVSAQTVDQGCVVCHKTSSSGVGPKAGAPSCFSSAFTNADGSSTVCHTSGPGLPPHVIDGSYRAAALHGKDAKQDLTACQPCHAEPGGPGSNPRFNVAVGTLGSGCETCHSVNYAHPIDWAGPNQTFHYSAGNIQAACGLCHGPNLLGPDESDPVQAVVGVNCFTCHLPDPTFTMEALDCTFCHGTPPLADGSANDLHVPGAVPVDHAPTLPGQTVSGFLTAHGQCSICHGVSEGGTGLLSPLNADYVLFDKDNDVLGDHWNDLLMMNGTAGADYDQTNTFGCNQACHLNDADHQMSDSQLSIDFGNFGGGSGTANCTGCHGYPPLTDGGPNDTHVVGATPVDHAPTLPTNTLADFLAAHDDCVICHGTKESQTTSGTHDPHPNYSVTTNHQNNEIEMNGSTGYNQGNNGCDTVVCHLNDADHQLTSSGLTVNDTLDFGGGGGCAACHDDGGGVSGAPQINDSSPHSLATTGYNCQDCHTAHNAGTITIPNNGTLGINYSQFESGIALGNVVAGVTGATEAEICWNCHDLEGVSEWGLNTDTNGAETNYNFGSLTSSNWVGATWSSAVSGFSYKTGTIQSTHAASTAAGTGGGASRSGVDDVDAIRCSFCHDVHDTFGPNGKPFLRGTWMGNPYKEDGAPRAGMAGVAPILNDFGAVPRGGAAHTELGGYQIDQNNGNPTAGWTLASSAGLCVLCHGNDVNNLNQYGVADVDWVGTNGHANAAIGGTGVASGMAANVYREAIRRSVAVPPVTTGEGQNAGNPMMAYMHVADGTSGRGYGFRSRLADENRGWDLLPNTTNTEGRPYAWNLYDWGASVRTDTTDDRYHEFSCSKCHNPHASRLPRLMITNCLDTNHNTWDDPRAGIEALPPAGTDNKDFSDVISVDNGNVTWSNSTSAQNCHRVRDTQLGKTNIPVGGWNTVTPWVEF